MKTSKFLTTVLNKFHNGKNYTRYPFEYSGYIVSSPDYWRTKASKGHNNLIGMIDMTAKKADVPRSVVQKAKLSIGQSLGHTNVDGFGNSGNTRFGAVKAVLKAAINRERANGN